MLCTVYVATLLLLPILGKVQAYVWVSFSLLRSSDLALLTTRNHSATTNCSIGIGRVSFRDNWDLTVYNVPLSAQRQDYNIIATLKRQPIGKGESITVPTSAGVPQAITISNVDNAPVFTYNVPELRSNWNEPR